MTIKLFTSTTSPINFSLESWQQRLNFLKIKELKDNEIIKKCNDNDIDEEEKIMDE